MTVLTVPIYAVAILGEIIVSNLHHLNLYNKKDTLNNFIMTIINMLLDLGMRGVYLLSMAFVFQFAFVHWPSAGWIYWILIIVFTDLVYWFVHWLSHSVRFFWAVHSVHHSSEKYNITVGFRSSVFEPLYRCFFFLPLALVGFRAADIMLAFAIQQLYGSLVHTQLIKHLPFWEIIFVSPSHHRVHHASNPRYLDKNMGMILIVWDKLFGTFEKEDNSYQKIKFGLTKNLDSFAPNKVLFHEWKQMYQDIKLAPTFIAKLKYIFGPPGWSHDNSRFTSNKMRENELRELQQSNG
jgi:sterol desaturase/sphingolipid hydroxylase (fatty acid hydroxylase superfamily)